MESAAGPPGARRAEGRTPRGGALSSAILYLAIVAIWAGVLIPRWLRRDSSSTARVGDDLTTAEPDSAGEEEPAPRSRRSRREATLSAEAARSAEARPAARPEERAEIHAVRADGRLKARVEGRAEGHRRAPEDRREAPRGEPRRGGPRDQDHNRVLSARRRLFGMLLMLVIASGTLAFTVLAAWWVVVPPSAMLLGYMALLREAAKADAERREVARPSAPRARSSAASPAAASPAAGPAPVPDAEVIDISASRGSTVQAGEEFYDQYADAKLRAVGDLARALPS